MKKNRKKWFRVFKCFLRLINKRPEFVFLEGKPEQGSIILSNHVGTTAPLKYELYFDHQFRFWGAHQMNDGMKSMYKYLSTTFYQEKKHWKPFPAKVVAFLGTPITTVIYKGIRLISTYKDTRLRKTLKESIDTLNNNESIIIFPEDSTLGYLDELVGFHPGFVLLLNQYCKDGKDVPIYTSYYQKKQNRFVMGKKFMYSDFVKQNLTKEEIAEILKDECNKLGKYKSEEELKEEQPQEKGDEIIIK